MRIEPSGTVSVYAQVLDRRHNGERIYNFSAGDPLLPNHSFITQAALSYVQKGESPYPSVEGIPELRKSAANWLNATCKTDVAADQILVTPGGKFALYTLILALLEREDEVLFAAPYWVSYPGIVKLAGGTPKILATHPENGWKLTPDTLLQSLSKKSKVLLFNNACNPTGALYTRQEVQAILDAAKEANLQVISDEVYSGIVYEGEFVSCGSFPEHRERVFLVQSCSKNFAMAGWRIGFAIADERMAKDLKHVLTQTATGCPTVCQWAAYGAVEHFDEVNRYVAQAMQLRRNTFYTQFQKLFSVELEKPRSGLYAFVPLALFEATDSVRFCHEALEQAHVALVPGLYFGAEGYIRFAFSDTEENIALGLQSLVLSYESFSCFG
ncbi:MAG: aminotransferase class I/II-fold pyridoxal phosphate-dependent enzyme [Parachlamydia sp.]|nr:aminotransferase class I/II-fold pyridoxal phosphate-dependent enzyme [Parachlamydia sp.]